jgi:hypothetical protein
LLSAEWKPLLLDTSGDKSLSSGPGLIFAGVYSVAKLPKLGDGALYWVKVSCTGGMHAFTAGEQETDKLLEVHEYDPSIGEKVTADSRSTDKLALKSRIALLRKYGMTEVDMAKVLQVDVQLLRQVTLNRSDTAMADALFSEGTHDLQYDRGFEFPVEVVCESVVSFELMCQKPSAKPRSLGVYKCKASELSSCPNGTSWRTVEVPNTCCMLKLKLGLRYLETATT